MILANARRQKSLRASKFEISRSLWIWVYRVPWLPDIGSDVARIDSTGLLFGYQNLAESLASGVAPETALQIRITAMGNANPTSGTVDLHIIGRARTRDAAQRLEGLLHAALPAEIPLQPIDDLATVRNVLLPLDPLSHPHAASAEIRRRVEDADIMPGAALDTVRTMPSVLRWEPDKEGLRVSISALSRCSTPTVLVLHMEPSQPSIALLDHLDSTVREIVGDADPAVNPIRRHIAGNYLKRIRDLPRAALNVRIQVHAAGSIMPGLVESIGIGLTSQESFAIVTPVNDHELALASELLESVTARWWSSSTDEIIDELLQICDTDEAAGVFRFPLPAYGGTMGLPSAPLNTLPRGAHIDGGASGSAVYLGDATGGGQVKVTLRELNQHLLVAGLPGFGKSTSVQTLLYRLWTEHRVPFLILDPAKSDYSALADSFPAGEARRISLSPAKPAFNPFAVPEGCTPQTHAGRVLAAFDAALGLSSQWQAGYITFGRALFAAYEEAEPGSWPTLRTFYASLGDTIRRSRFSGPDGSNARASLLGRLEFLVRGPVGAALISGSDGQIDWRDLMSRPTIIEMKEFGGPAERSLVFALLLAGLISYREANPTQAGSLGHVTVLEEAHRALSGTSEAESEGVRLLVEAIAELRGSGQGFIIVDQAPTLLHPGVLKLSGSILTHRLVEPTERLIVGSAVLLDERQQVDLARLGMGEAILYSSDRTSCVVLDVEREADLGRGVPARRFSTLSNSASIDAPWCIGCRDMCRHAARGREVGSLLAAAGAPAGRIRPAVDHLCADGVKPTNSDLHAARCGAGRYMAGGVTGGADLGGFLAGLRDLDDQLEELAASIKP